MGEHAFPQRLRDLLDPIGRKLGMEGAVEAGRVFSRWRSIVGPDVASHVEPTSLRDGVLRVRADSPTWATEIGYLADEIAGRVNAALGSRVVTELRVSAGPKLGGPSTAPQKPQQPRAGAEPRGTSEGPVEDPREALARARRAWEARNRKMRSDQDF